MTKSADFVNNNKSNTENLNVVEQDLNLDENETPIEAAKSTTTTGTGTGNGGMTTRVFLFGLLANCIAHLTFGLDVVLSRYLQRKSKLPALSVLINAHVLSLILYSPRTFYLFYRIWVQYRQQKQRRQRKMQSLQSTSSLSSLNNEGDDNDGNNSSSSRSTLSMKQVDSRVFEMNELINNEDEYKDGNLRRELKSNAVTNSNDESGGGEGEDDEDDDEKTYFLLKVWKNPRVIVHGWLFFVFAVLVTARVVGAFYSTRFTSSTISQLVMLVLPFMILILGYPILKEKITIISLVALAAIVGGGVLVVLGSFNTPKLPSVNNGSALSLSSISGFESISLGYDEIRALNGSGIEESSGYTFYWTIDLAALSKAFSIYDILGICLSLGSTVALAFMNITVKVGAMAVDFRRKIREKERNNPLEPSLSSVSLSEYSDQQTDAPMDTQEDAQKEKKSLWLKTNPFGAEAFFYSQMIAIPCFLLLPSILIEDWSRWLYLKPVDWVIFSMTGVLVTLVASQCSFIGMQVLGAANAGSMLALRLVSAIIFAGFLLNEWICNIYQIIGSVVVLVSVTGFLLLQRLKK